MILQHYQQQHKLASDAELVNLRASDVAERPVFTSQGNPQCQSNPGENSSSYSNEYKSLQLCVERDGIDIQQCVRFIRVFTVK